MKRRDIELSRRSFLRTVACCGAGAVAQGVLPGPMGYGVAFANSCFSGNRSLVTIFLGGGLCSHELLVPRGSTAQTTAYLDNNNVTGIREQNLTDPNNPEHIAWRARRRNQYVSANHVLLPINGHSNFGLHWAMGEALPNPSNGNPESPLPSGQRSIRQMMNTAESGGMNAAIINKVGYPSPNYSHEESHTIVATGERRSFNSAKGWLGRLADTYCISGGQQTPLSFFSFHGRVPEVRAQNVAPYLLDGKSILNERQHG